MKKLLKYFMRGLLFIVPVAATVYAVYWIFTTIDTTVLNLIIDEKSESEPIWWHHGLGVVISVAVITGIGVLSSLFITKPLIQLIEKIFTKLPLIKLLYSSIKDLIGAFVGDKKKFDQPVTVTLIPGDEAIKAIGFITRESLDFWGMDDYVTVYLPQSYNFAGNLIVVPKNRVTKLDADSGDVMSFIVSGGVSGPASPSDKTVTDDDIVEDI